MIRAEVRLYNSYDDGERMIIELREVDIDVRIMQRSNAGQYDLSQFVYMAHISTVYESASYALLRRVREIIQNESIKLAKALPIAEFNALSTVLVLVTGQDIYARID